MTGQGNTRKKEKEELKPDIRNFEYTFSTDFF